MSVADPHAVQTQIFFPAYARTYPVDVTLTVTDNSFLGELGLTPWLFAKSTSTTCSRVAQELETTAAPRHHNARPNEVSNAMSL